MLQPFYTKPTLLNKRGKKPPKKKNKTIKAMIQLRKILQNSNKTPIPNSAWNGLYRSYSPAPTKNLQS